MDFSQSHKQSKIMDKDQNASIKTLSKQTIILQRAVQLAEQEFDTQEINSAFN